MPSYKYTEEKYISAHFPPLMSGDFINIMSHKQSQIVAKTSTSQPGSSLFRVPDETDLFLTAAHRSVSIVVCATCSVFLYLVVRICSLFVYFGCAVCVCAAYVVGYHLNCSKKSTGKISKNLAF